MEQYDKNLFELLEVLVDSIQDPKQEIIAKICLQNLKKENKQEETIKQSISQVAMKSMPIIELNLSTKAKHALLNGGIQTVWQLREASFNQLIKMRHLGAKMIMEISKVLTEKFKY